MGHPDEVTHWLNNPKTWEQIADAIGSHDYTYDLSDSSHRMDVVQIVCEVASKIRAR